MDKILSICVPSFNMEKCLDRNVESFAKSKEFGKIEVIIVNDGSKDNTLSVAKNLEQKYPDSVVVIDKQNGHYGSCVNAALKVAKGKYFRIVDADDWVDSNALNKLIYDMESNSVDCFYSQFSLVYEGTDRNEVVDDYGIKKGKVIDLSEYNIPYRCLAMHNLSFRTSLFSEINYKQTEGICYTDTEYVYIPFSYSKTLFASDVVLYQYLIGRDGQTIDAKSLMRNFSHFEKLYNNIVLYDENRINEPSYNSGLHDWCLFRLISYMAYIAIILNKRNKTEISLLSILFDKIEKQEPSLYAKTLTIKIHGIPYVKCWRRNSIFDRLILSLINLK